MQPPRRPRSLRLQGTRTTSILDEARMLDDGGQSASCDLSVGCSFDPDARVFAIGLRRRRTIPERLSRRALAHVVQNKVEAAYRRTDLFERRRKLMDDWAAYLDGVPRTDNRQTPLTRGDRSGFGHRLPLQITRVLAGTPDVASTTGARTRRPTEAATRSRSTRAICCP